PAHPPRPPLFPYTTLFRSALRERGFVKAIELEAMAMPLPDLVLAVDAMRHGTGNEVARISAKPHRAPELVDAEQIAQLVNDLVRSEEHTSELQSQSNLVCR